MKHWQKKLGRKKANFCIVRYRTRRETLRPPWRKEAGQPGKTGIFTHNTQENKMNAFELRYAAFYQAKELLENNYKASMAAWDLMDKTSKQLAETAPKFPTMSEVIDAAMQINKFVSESTEKELTKAAKKVTGF